MKRVPVESAPLPQQKQASTLQPGAIIEPKR
jgi:hypothetical protein